MSMIRHRKKIYYDLSEIEGEPEIILIFKDRMDSSHSNYSIKIGEYILTSSNFTRKTYSWFYTALEKLENLKSQTEIFVKRYEDCEDLYFHSLTRRKVFVGFLDIDFVNNIPTYIKMR